MKKLFYLFSGLIVALCVASCGSDEPDPVRTHREPVDLGLSVKWAPMNIGASSPEAYGALYGWADSAGNHQTLDERITIAYQSGNIVKCDWHSPYFGGMSPLANISGTDYDIAAYTWGADWRVPTRAEMQELIDKCTFTPETTTGGVVCLRATGPNGNSILLPLAGIRETVSAESRGAYGYYWTADLLPKASQSTYGYDSNVACAAWSATMSATTARPTMSPILRNLGLSIRPVTPK